MVVIYFKDTEVDVQNLIRDIKLKWNDIEKVSEEILRLNAEEKEAEMKYFKNRKKEYAETLFRAK